VETLFPFRHAWVLGFLILPALLLVWVWARRSRGTVLPLDHSPARDGRWLGFFVNLAESLPALLLAVAILLLAGPQRWAEPRTQRALTNIEFCVDVSGSMTAKFGEGTRYDASMEAINGFLDYREGDAFGLTFFGNAVLHWVPLTTDVSAFRCAPPFMQPGQLPYWFNGTEIGKALLACRKVLTQRDEGDRLIILISDGFSADLYGGRDEEIARQLRDDNIVLYEIHVANTEVPDPIVNMTALTGGQVFNPDDPSTLDAVFRHIDEMQVTRLEKVHAEAVDDHRLLCWLGIGAAGLALLFSLGLRYTPW